MKSLMKTGPPLPAAVVQLTQLAAGEAARLHTVDLVTEDAALLEALGMTRSCRFRVCKIGDPWIVQVRETRIGLAESVARRLLVIPEAAF
jgi:Fe2+ transport system protein FeoA